jgi:DNA-damage-inducible protein D
MEFRQIHPPGKYVAKDRTMKKEVITRLHRSFEECAHHQDGVEFWYARELQHLLGYAKWENFEQVIGKAKVACANSGHAVEDHFPDVRKMVGIGSETSRPINDLVLTRYACYLAEVERVQAREKLTTSQKNLSGVMYERGVDQQGFGRIVSKGDAALFGGKTTHDMKSRLGVPEGRPLADFLPTLTIKAKDFANEVTSVQIKEQDLNGEVDISREHVRNNADVRKILTDRNIRPEALPPAEDLKKVERRLKSEEKKLPKTASTDTKKKKP